MKHRLGTSQAKELFAENGWEWQESWMGAEVKPIKRPHTRTQQGKYWVCLHEFGKAQGYSVGETETWLHNAILCEAYGTKEHKQIGGSYVAIPNQRSSDADIDEYSLLIETLLRVAGDQGYTFRRAA